MELPNVRMILAEPLGINRKSDGLSSYKDHYTYIERRSEEFLRRLYFKGAEDYEKYNPLHFFRNIFIFFWILIFGGQPERYWMFHDILFYSFTRGISRFQDNLYDILSTFDKISEIENDETLDYKWKKSRLERFIPKEVTLAQEAFNKIKDSIETEKANIERWKRMNFTNEEILECIDSSLESTGGENVPVIIHKKTENYEFEIHDEYHGRYYIEVFLPDKILAYYERAISLDEIVKKYTDIAIKFMDEYRKTNSEYRTFNPENVETKDIDFLVRCNRLRNITAEDLLK